MYTRHVNGDSYLKFSAAFKNFMLSHSRKSEMKFNVLLGKFFNILVLFSLCSVEIKEYNSVFENSYRVSKCDGKITSKHSQVKGKTE